MKFVNRKEYFFLKRVENKKEENGSFFQSYFKFWKRKDIEDVYWKFVLSSLIIFYHICMKMANLKKNIEISEISFQPNNQNLGY